MCFNLFKLIKTEEINPSNLLFFFYIFFQAIHIIMRNNLGEARSSFETDGSPFSSSACCSAPRPPRVLFSFRISQCSCPSTRRKLGSLSFSRVGDPVFAVIRTLTGHRSNCISVDFHPFGEFFASGSLDTNLKIWDIRRKGCIHTYKGHTRGVNSIRFTPDGRWVVSGGEDSVVKLWDLTAGKLLHDFKCHDGQIQCIDFHPHEFLLATGSADKTVKFWDLETFELIGSAGPEVSGVRSMTFNPDGRTLLCGLYESLKVFSWEPVRCHDAVDVGWSKLLDMNVQEGKLLGCSYNQSCVGVWVVDISFVEGNGPANLHTISKSDVMPVIVPRTSVRLEPATEFAKENDGEISLTQNIQSKPMDSRRPSSFRDGSVRTNVSIQPEFMDNKSDGQIPDQDLLNVANSVNQLSNNRERIIDVVRTIGNGKLRANLSVGPSTSYQHESNDVRIHKPRDPSSFDMPRGGRTRTLVQNWERRERSPRYEGPNQSDSSDIIPSETSKPYTLKERSLSTESETVSASDEDAIADLLEHHEQFIDARGLPKKIASNNK
ncbi:hypothetical protein HPP92_013987 [Vanilla planifolia]|uniref:Katanin p80 WD40 repeat-containing subunit B1 homolog n=1 Tax=Vanilla planifolia TaxID=51239 RepID=A0A835QNM2_VANPL|nr:hypothetical protein HPP92_013987 [Vanilla planifolia]